MKALSDSKTTKIALWSPFRGKVGTEKAVVNYARTLKEIGCEVVIIQLLDEFETYKDEFRLIRVWPKKMDCIGKSNFLFRRDFYVLGSLSTKRLQKILNSENFDMAISFLMAVPLINATKHSKICSPKLILSVQGYPKFLLKNDNLLSKLENKLRTYLWEKNYQFADKILLMTKYTERQLGEIFPSISRKFSVLENPLFDSGIEHESNLSKDITRKIFFVGRYSYQKDFQLFAETTRILSQNPLLSLEFHVFGNFPDKIKDARENCHLNFRGHEQDFWRSLSNENDIHLITARWEDPGHALLEGLAFGHRSVVADRSAPHVDLARTLGVPVTPPDPTAIASHIIEIIETQQTGKVNEQLSQHVLEIYGRNKFQQKITDIVSELSLIDKKI